MLAAHPVAYPLLRRVHGPVRRIPRLGVVVRDTELMHRVLRDGDTYSKVGKGGVSDLWTPVLGDKVLLNMHGPDHRALRRKLGPLFSPRAVRELTGPGLTPLLDAVTARLYAGQAVNLVDTAREGAAAMIAAIAGIDGGVVGTELFDRVQQLTGLVSIRRPALTPAAQQAARSALQSVTEAARTAFRSGREDTLPGRLRSLGLDEREAIGAVAAFVITGTETLAAHLPRALAMLIDGGHWATFVTADAERRRAFMDECLRVTTPTPLMIRLAERHDVLAGLRIRAGDRLLLATFLANRQPGDFDPSGHRAEGQRQLWFGAGEHFCIGAPLALEQLRTVTDRLADCTREAGMPLTVVDRRPRQRVLVPAYRTLSVQLAVKEKA